MATSTAATVLPSIVGYTRLGKSGLKVSKVILGTMGYGSPNWGGGWVLGEEESMKHFKAAWELGINTWDTADVYSNGESERLVGKAIKELQIPRDEVVIMTKVFYGMDKEVMPVGGSVNLRGLSRKHIFDAIKGSLERLQLDYVDVLQCHRFDPDTPISETMDALHDVVKSGLARYIGMSTCRAYQFHEMQNYAKRKGQTQFISMQDHYSPLYRESENELQPTLDLFGVGSIPWSPLARGYLTRPHATVSKTTRAEKDPHLDYMVGTTTRELEVSKAVNEAIEKIAMDRGYSMAQITVAWSLSNSTVSAPIIGSTRVESLLELAQATHIVLTAEEIESIGAAYLPRRSAGLQ